MDKVYRVLSCDFCGEEVTERYIGNKPYDGGPTTSSAFERNINSLLMLRPKGEMKKWFLCAHCADAVERVLSSFAESAKGVG